jgi:AraC-like DNA-binding protein
MVRSRDSISDRLDSVEVDAIAGLLDGPRARRAFLLRCTMDPPWALRIEDEAPLSVVAMLRGRACFAVDGDQPQWLEAGDVALLRGPDHYLFADDPATPPQAIIHPSQRCTTPDGQDIPQMRSFGVRRWGNAPDGATEVLTGTYNLEGEISRRLLDALPPQLVLRSDEWQTPVLGLLADEMLRDDVGQDAVLDRLLDLLLIHAVRAYFARRAPDAPGWFRAQSDPVIGRAVRLLQDNPAEAWTLASLARETRVSRATLARRFTEVVGQPPMEFLTEWRLTLAADLILDPAETIASVAGKVGYGSGYALSAAFKRVRGIRPGQHRHAERLRPPSG